MEDTGTADDFIPIAIVSAIEREAERRNAFCQGRAPESCSWCRGDLNECDCEDKPDGFIGEED